MGGNSARSGNSDAPMTVRSAVVPKKKFSFKPLVGTLLKGVLKQKKASDQNMLDYEGEAAGVTTRRSNAQAMRERTERREAGEFEDNSGTTISNVSISTSPTTAEVSQSEAATATDATADTIQTKKKKTKATGRSMTILTSSKGVKSDDKLTLGKKSLLGK